MITLKSGSNGNFNDVEHKRDQYRYCANSKFDACNWLLSDKESGEFCLACQLNHTIPSLSDTLHIQLWKKLELAKHRLVYALLKLELPVVSKALDPKQGLAFDFLAEKDARERVIMGHENGLITINLAEADEVKRVSLREQLHEPYRTILGHFRHEVGHYYWDRLIFPNEKNLKNFRKLFGDEQSDYGNALQRYYKNGPPPDWAITYISAYATSHPWEDWAETWAHYLHIMDALEIANSFGLRIDPDEISRSEKLSAKYQLNPYETKDFQKLVDLWFPLTVAMNSLNRSIGQPDFYPFVMPVKVIEKMKFIHSICYP